MLDISEALSAIVNGLDETVKNAGFSLYYPEGADKRSLPFVDEDKRKYICYDGDGCSLKIEFSGRTVSLFYADSATSDAAGNSDYASLSTSLLEAETSDEKDVKYITEEFIETIENKFAGGKKPKAAKKNIQTVSKTAVKNGAYYDAATFGNRFTTVYPELRVYYKENIDRYGEFLPEDFFKKYGTPAVMQTIRENDPVKMRKLFNLLNDIYDNGINDVQSLIVVSILGNMYDDDELLANCVDYMDGDLCVNVIRVNKYLKTSTGMKMRLENPPKYKPKKAKKKSLLASLMGGAPQQ